MRNILTIILLLAALTVAAQNYSPCYKEKYAEGVSLYNNGRYSEAKAKFVAAKGCPMPNTAQADEWIKKCNKEIKRLAEEKRKAEEQAAKIKQKAEREVRDQAQQEANTRTRMILNIDTAHYTLQPSSITVFFSYSKPQNDKTDIKRRGLCYAETSYAPQPTMKNNVIFFTEESVFQIIDNLTPETKYSVCAFNEKIDGTIEYGVTLSLETPPCINTSQVTEITDVSAVVASEILCPIPDTITMAGACWSLKNDHPTLSNTRTSDVVTNGRWRTLMGNLRYDTEYYVRAYVITTSGRVYYGNVMRFKTKDR